MGPFSNSRSIKTRLKWVIISTVLITLIVASAALFIYESQSLRKIQVSSIQTKAQIISENINASIIFRDSSDASRVLKSLKAQPDIIAAAVYDADNKLFVYYSKSKFDVDIPTVPSGKNMMEEDGALYLFKPILLDEKIGTLYLKSDLSIQREQISSLFEILFLVLIGSSVVAYFIAVLLEKKISTPILNLAGTIRKVSDLKDYSIRASKTSNDETGYLADSFNEFLEQIQMRDANLRQSNKNLLDEIAERKKTEEVLSESENRFRNIFFSHPLPMWVYDQESFRFLQVNAAAVKKYGYSFEEFLKMSILDIRPPEAAKQLTEHLKETRQPLEHSGPWVHRLKDGTIIDVEIFSHSTLYEDRAAVLVVALDITERLKAENDLIKAEERYRNTLDNLMEGCQIISRDFRYLYLNNVGAKQTRYKKEELLGNTMLEMHPGFEQTEIFKQIERCMRDKTNHRMISKFVHPDGSQEWYDIDIHSVPEGVFIISTDITKEKELNDELEKYRVHLEDLVRERTIQLEAVNKELESFSYSVSHDLRAPLRHIDGFAELLKKSSAEKLDSRSFHFLEMISDSAKQMGILIDELLVFSRMGRKDMNKVRTDMNAVVRDVLTELNSDTASRNIKWEFKDLPEAEVDPLMIKLVFQNLIGNAVKYSRFKDPAKIKIGFEPGDREIIYSVKDNGAGFDMKYSDKLFGVFQRLHSSTEFEGTGIGLANVQRIIMRHGGRVWANGEVNKGAEFYFTIPVKD